MWSRVETLLFEVSLDVWHMCLRVETMTAWSYTTCVSETRAQKQLQVALDVWHVFLSWNMDCWKVNLQSWTRQVELNHRLLEVVLYHCTCVLELKHWLLEVVLPVSLDVWHVFVRWNIDSLTVTCKNGHVKSSWNLTVWSLTVCMAHVS